MRTRAFSQAAHLLFSTKLVVSTSCLAAAVACSNAEPNSEEELAAPSTSLSTVPPPALAPPTVDSSTNSAAPATPPSTTAGMGHMEVLPPPTNSGGATGREAPDAGGVSPLGGMSGESTAPATGGSSPVAGMPGEPEPMASGGEAGAGGAPAPEAVAGAAGVPAAGAPATGGQGGADNGEKPPQFRSPGCDAGAPLSGGAHSFNLDGNDRRYTVHLPQNYDPARAWPLVLALHPNGGYLNYWDGTSGDRNIRGKYGNDAIIVIAQAIGGNWRDYGAPESSWPGRVEMELAYFDQVLSEAKQGLCIDQRSIFAMGFSGGGSFSGVLGCRRTDLRAFAAGGSVIYFDPDTCVGNAAAWIVLSEGDSTPDRRAYRDFFVQRAGCEAANEPQNGCHEYQGCAVESPVTFCSHPGGHDWPSFGVDDAWTFFSQFIEQ